MQEARLSNTNKITLPKAVREALGAVPGDKIRFVPARHGFRVVVIRQTLRDLNGSIKSPHKKPVTIAQMNKTISRMGVDAEPTDSPER